ncbi:hypothetical protein B566_EDAN018713 [Ephemera danica]|nr:hypothetical protein B566_EDAN018713 [Ephemera danica]
MEIVHGDKDLERYMREAVKVSEKSPVLLDRFLDDAIEVDVDAISDGTEVMIGGIMEHIEQAGVHSGDSACSLPPYSLPKTLQDELRRQTVLMAKALKVKGLMNVQFAIQGVGDAAVVFVLEVNPRASRTVPFVSKATGQQLAKIAARCMAGQSLASQQGLAGQPPKEVVPPYFSVKEAVFPFNKFPGVDPILGPEMRSTGEVMGVAATFGEAMLKSQLGAGSRLPRKGAVVLTVKNGDKARAVAVAADLVKLGFTLVATKGTAAAIAAAGLPVKVVNKVKDGRPHIADMVKAGEIQLVQYLRRCFAPRTMGQGGAAVGALNGTIIALDMLPMEPIEGVQFLLGDFRQEAVIQALKAAVDGRMVDVVVSDMAPNLSGIESADSARIEHLVELAVEFAEDHLCPGGVLVCKVFHGSGYDTLVKLFKSRFRVVKPIKPKASRDKSSETFLVGFDRGVVQGQQVGYSDFLEEVRTKRIKSVTLQESPSGGTDIIAVNTEGNRIRSTATYLDRGLVGDLIANGVKFDVKPREEPSMLADIIARGTPGFSGADLANLVNEAALFAARRNARVVEMIDFEKAKDKIMMGAERKSMVMDEEERRNTAYHESGHALIGRLLPKLDPVHKVTIIPRGGALGVTVSLPEKDRYSTDKIQMLSRISMLFGGRIAEEVHFMSRQHFGTDGIRGTVGTAPITPDFMLKLGHAVGCVLRRSIQKPTVVIGKDTRISGYMLESALEAGFASAGVDVLLTGPLPTPGVAYLTRALRLDLGVVISASHNPFDDNGIKFFSARGEKLPDEWELAVEAQLDMPPQWVDSASLGRARRLEDARGRYIEFCKASVGSDLSLKGLHVVIDAAHGAGYHVAPDVFHELGAHITTLGCKPDGMNINKDVGATAPAALVATVREQGADYGDVNALAFFGYAYYAENMQRVKALPIVEKAGKAPVLPSEASVLDGSYQPLSRPIFVYVNVKSLAKPEVKEFTEYMLKHSAKIAKEVKYVPLPPKAYVLGLEHVNKVKKGTVFGGKNEVGVRIDDLLAREAKL